MCRVTEHTTARRSHAKTGTPQPVSQTVLQRVTARTVQCLLKRLCVPARFALPLGTCCVLACRAFSVHVLLHFALRALSSQLTGCLPVQPREALVEAELDDPVVLRCFPRASLSRLGICEGGHRVYAYEQALGTGDVVGDTSAHVCESPTASDVLVRPIGAMATMGTLTIGSAVGTGIHGTRGGTGSSGKRARGKRSKAAQSASVSSSVPVISPLVSESGVGGVKDALSLAVEESPSGILEAGGAFPVIWGVLRKVVIPKLPEILRLKNSPLVASHRAERSADGCGGEVQNFPAGLIPSELSAHQMAPSGVIAHSSPSELSAHQMPPSGVIAHWRSRPALQFTSPGPGSAPPIEKVESLPLEYVLAL